MNIIYLTAVLVFILCALMKIFSSQDPGTGQIRSNPVLYFLFLLLLIFVSGFRERFIDTTDYRMMYDAVGTSFRAVVSPEDFQLGGVESGYILFTVLLHFISDDSQLLLVVCACIILPIAGHVVKKYSSDLPYSLLLLFLLYFISTMNGIRQVVASSIIALVILSKKEEHSTPFVMLCIVFASFFHRSALLFIPIYFIIRQKLANGYIIGLFVFSLLTLLAPAGIMDLLSIIVGMERYSYVFENQEGMNLLRFAESCVIPVLILIFSKKIDEDKNLVMLSNLVLISFCFSIICINNLLFGRLTMYFTLYGIILLPHLIEKGFEKQTAGLVKVTSIVLYTAFFIFQVRAYGGMDNFRLIFWE